MPRSHRRSDVGLRGRSVRVSSIPRQHRRDEARTQTAHRVELQRVQAKLVDVLEPRGRQRPQRGHASHRSRDSTSNAEPACARKWEVAGCQSPRDPENVVRFAPMTVVGKDGSE